MKRSLCLLCLLCLSAACGSSSGAGADDVGDVVESVGDIRPDLEAADTPAAEDIPAAGPQSRLGGDDYALVVLEEDTRIVLLRGEEELLALERDGLQLGVVDVRKDNLSYDPWPLVAGDSLYQPPDGLRWLSVTSMALAEPAEEGPVLVDLTYDEGLTARLALALEDTGRFRAALLPQGDSPAVVMMRLRARVDGQEGFYGLGEWFDTPNHRGLLRAMQLELDTAMRRGYNEAHVPIPYLTGTTGWGLFVEDFHPGVFDVATQAADIVEATFGTGPDSGEGLVFHLFAAAHPLDLTRHYYEATAYPRVPAPWALGPWIWRDENEDQAQVENDLDTIRELDLATTAYWIDRPYATAVNTFDYGAEKFTDADAMIAKMHALGFRTALWHTPYLDESSAATADLRAEAVDNGYYPPSPGALFNGWGKPVDLTNPDAYAWWQELIRLYTNRGVEGFKLDYGEDVLVGLAGGRSPWAFYDGSTERTMHSRYQLFYHRVYAELLPEDGGFLICRGGTFGDQANCNVIWPGDLDANMGRHREENDEGKLGVGGLPAAVSAGSSLGPSGYPFFGSDTGGYDFSPPNKETFTRWFQHTALTPVMQIGTSSSDVAWEFTADNGFDEETLDLYREFTRLHLRLFPFFWSYAQRIAEDGRPIQRAFGLAYPEMGEHPPYIYLLGEELLVAPVVDEGARQWNVLVPEGTWTDWFTGETLTGYAEVTVEAPLDKLPLYLRAGAMVPMLRDTIDTLAPTDEPERVDSFATAAGELTVRVAPGDGSFAVYDGTSLSQTLSDTTLEISVTPGTVFSSGVRFEIHGFAEAPSGVQIDGSDTEAWELLSGAGGMLQITLGDPLALDAPHTVTITR